MGCLDRHDRLTKLPQRQVTSILSLNTILTPAAHPLQVGWNSRNSNGVRARTVSAALYNMCVQTSGIIAANIYQEDDAPRYQRGNKVLLSILVLNMFLYIGTKVYYVKRNAWRERKWNAMTEDEKLGYLATTDEGNKRLDFRFTH